MNVKDKILEYIEYKGITMYSVEKRLGWSHYSVMSSKSIKSERLCEFIRVYDDISLDWLFRDEGPMLRETGTKITSMNPIPEADKYGFVVADTESIPSNKLETYDRFSQMYENMIRDLKKMIEDKDEEILRLRSRLQIQAKV